MNNIMKAVRILLLLSAPGLLHADLIILTRGDIIFGKVINQGEINMTVEIRQIQFNPSNLAKKPETISLLDNTAKISFKDGTIFSGKLDERKQFTVIYSDGLLAASVLYPKVLIKEVKPSEKVEVAYKLKPKEKEAQVASEFMVEYDKKLDPADATTPELKKKLKQPREMTVEDSRSPDGIRKIRLDTVETVSKTVITAEGKEEKAIFYPEEKAQTDKLAEIDRIQTKSSFFNDYKPRAGLAVAPYMPMGAIGGALGMGFGFQLDGNVYLPFSFLKVFKKLDLEPRAGLNIGFASFSSNSPDYTASVSIIPVIAYGRLGWANHTMKKYGIGSYGKFGLGMTPTSLSKSFNSSVTKGNTTGNVSESVSSMDGTFLLGAGATYNFKNVKALQKVDFFLEFDYMMAFESVTGSYLVIAMGANYGF